MSRYDSRILKILAAGAALAAAYFACAPAAHGQEAAAEETSSQGLEAAFGASYSSNGEGNDFDFSTLAVRYHHDWNDRWGIEGSYTRQDFDSFDADIYELSARFTFYQNDRIRLFALAGGGYLSYDWSLPTGGTSSSGSDDAPVYHAGIAAQIALGENLYLRPDFRHRRAIDLYAPYDESSNEATLGFGYRF